MTKKVNTVPVLSADGGREIFECLERAHAHYHTQDCVLVGCDLFIDGKWWGKVESWKPDNVTRQHAEERPYKTNEVRQLTGTLFAQMTLTGELTFYHLVD